MAGNVAGHMAQAGEAGQDCRVIGSVMNHDESTSTLVFFFDWCSLCFIVCCVLII